jgi:cytochrome P450 PksS
MEDTVNRFKIWSAENRQNPHPLYRQMREETPVYRAIGPVSGNPFNFFTQYDAAAAMLKDQRFIKDFRKTISEEERQAMANDPSAMLNDHMLQRDPPEHTRLRALVGKAFTPRMVASLEPRIAAIAEELITQMKAETGAVDFIEAFAFPLPITVIAELLGIPPEERDTFRRWTKTLLFESEQEKRVMAVMEFVRFCNEALDERRAAPRDDLLSALVTTEEDGDTLTHQEVISMIFLLLAAGHETTVNLLGNGMYTLLTHPEQLALLRANSDLTANAVEEILRYESPVENSLSRWASEDVEGDGWRVAKGEAVLAVLLSANRDEAIFTNPDTFDITRENAAKHIAFGQGIHYCLGAPLARLEGQVAFPLLLEAFPNMAVATDEVTWNDNLLFRGLTALPLHLN